MGIEDDDGAAMPALAALIDERFDGVCEHASPCIVYTALTVDEIVRIAEALTKVPRGAGLHVYPDGRLTQEDVNSIRFIDKSGALNPDRMPDGERAE